MATLKKGTKTGQLKHKTVEQELRKLSASLPEGAKLPSERNLAIEYDCNFLTVRKALKSLVEDGLIVRRIGSGTFIAAAGAKAAAAENRVGVLVFENGNAYAFSVFQAISAAGLSESIELRSCWVRDFADDGLRQAELLVNEGCVALTLPWVPHDKTGEVREFVSKCPVPVSLPILIPGLENLYFEEEHLFRSLRLSPTEGLCRYFYELGHRQIAFLGPDSPGDIVLQQKASDYACFISRERLTATIGMVSTGTAGVDRLAKRWKSLRGDLAIVSYDDEHALRFLTAMHKLGLRAPEDFAIVGFNNIDASHYSDPPLSTVEQDFAHIGHWLLKSAIALSRGKFDRSQSEPVLKFFVRRTCGGSGRIDGPFRARLERQRLNVCLEDSESASAGDRPQGAPPVAVSSAIGPDGGDTAG